VVSPSLRPSSPCRSSRAPRGRSTARRLRRGRRGLTVYVVLLVIAMLSAVGIFASRSASLATTQSGNYRQMVQTHYVTELAVLTTIAAIESDTPGYIAQMERHDDDYLQAKVDTLLWRKCRTFGANQRCYKFGREGIESRLGTSLLAPRPSTTEPLGEPGSLGRADVEAHFMVEATELAQVVSPIAGQRATDMPVTYYSLTLSATGEVGPPAVSGNEDFRSSAVSLETARVHLTVGPLPAR
jgi:hypothetical protein